MLGTLATVFGDHIKRVIKVSKTPTIINEDNVYQQGDIDVLEILDDMMVPLLLPGSSLEGMDNLTELHDKAKSGKSCLLLVEHYSNMDLGYVSILARQAGDRGKEIAESIIAIAGMKLNEDNPAVAAFTGAYSKIVICPSRSLQELEPEKDKEMILRGNAINRAAMKTIIRQKYKGNLILVFPSGTRYRPWEPDSKKGVRDIDSYIRSFDFMCFVAINGNTLHVQQTDMLNDIVIKDIVRVTVGPVVSCNQFRNKILETLSEEDDKKQAVADEIMNELEKMHVAAEEERQKLLNK
ncbi:MAG: 1-acyl-sn-glycerol-3-phosphate acyltransferase [Treponema sp.]|jgi:glycerol-3-phosphate O-acyltransferase|nr:1-acyl-sn-glycerol-3-phosphate acyltransferase [Treponema sp.]